MEKNTLALLGTKALDIASADPRADLSMVEQELRGTLPESYRAFLIAYGTPVVFENGAKFRPEERSAFDSPEGFQDLEILYGLGPSKNGLVYRNKHNQYLLPEWLITIGEAPGGNQICLAGSGDQKGRIYFWNHEAEEGSSLSLIARSFDEFLTRLEPDVEATGDTTGIVESESWLDF